MNGEETIWNSGNHLYSYDVDRLRYQRDITLHNGILGLTNQLQFKFDKTEDAENNIAKFWNPESGYSWNSTGIKNFLNYLAGRSPGDSTLYDIWSEDVRTAAENDLYFEMTCTVYNSNEYTEVNNGLWLSFPAIIVLAIGIGNNPKSNVDSIEPGSDVSGGDYINGYILQLTGTSGNNLYYIPYIFNYEMAMSSVAVGSRLLTPYNSGSVREKLYPSKIVVGVGINHREKIIQFYNRNYNIYADDSLKMSNIKFPNDYEISDKITILSKVTNFNNALNDKAEGAPYALDISFNFGNEEWEYPKAAKLHYK